MVTRHLKQGAKAKSQKQTPGPGGPREGVNAQQPSELQTLDATTFCFVIISVTRILSYSATQVSAERRPALPCPPDRPFSTPGPPISPFPPDHQSNPVFSRSPGQLQRSRMIERTMAKKASVTPPLLTSSTSASSFIRRKAASISFANSKEYGPFSESTTSSARALFAAPIRAASRRVACRSGPKQLSTRAWATRRSSVGAMVSRSESSELSFPDASLGVRAKGENGAPWRRERRYSCAVSAVESVWMLSGSSLLDMTLVAPFS
ncbi:hypothetical protein DFJ74DRAFT_131839 [Hyaloraphidium curvatum]|nr:hypothetical protein DFJ74DRAFT_131839 [Hyaloraphidium curvatum]